MFRSRYKPSLVFRHSPGCSKFNFKFSADIQLFDRKTISHGKSYLSNAILMSDLPT